MGSTESHTTVDVGTRVFDEDGTEIGTVRGITGDGFVVSTGQGIETLSVAHERSPPEVGEAELMWRCDACGEMGNIADLPETCPNCGASREQLYYYVDD
jgi:predicted RNA-binding Zn-ribbon protein involved in translation (DUF1610 family)